MPHLDSLLLNTTAQRLEAITDPALFERIATAVIRLSRPQYDTLSHVGINADERTVRAVLDGLGVTGASAALPATSGGRPVVLVAHTTTERSNLRRKWLDSGSQSTTKSRPTARTREPGDVVKAARITAAVKKEAPDARVVLILGTNRVPEVDVLLDVQKLAAAAGLELEVFDRSVLSDLLDFTADGTAVRRELLGVTTERLSAVLLRDIGKRSLEAYAGEHPGVGPDEWIERGEDDELSSILTSSASLIAVVGESGLGKSAVAWRALHRHLASGGVGLWVRAEHLSSASTVALLIDAALRDWQPILEPNAGSRALDLLRPSLTLPSEPQKSRELLLVIDDVMRQPDAQMALRRVLALARNEAPHADPPSSAAPESPTLRVRLLVPTWPEVWQALGDQHERASWVAQVSVTNLPVYRAQHLISAAAARRGVALSDQEATEIAERIAGDPLLAALLIESSDSLEDYFQGGARVIERFITNSLSALAGPGGGGHYTVAEYRSALEALSSRMLSARLLVPTWDDMVAWFYAHTDIRDALRDIMRQGRICRSSTKTASPLRFRHDRLRDALLSEACTTLVHRGQADDELLQDPLLSSYVGAALTSSNISSARMASICAASPAALAHALRIAGPVQFAARAKLVRTLLAWMRHELRDLRARDAMTPMLSAVFEPLSTVNSSEVLDLLAPWPAWRWVTLTRLAAGSMESGLQFFQTKGFEASTNDPWRDRAVSAALGRNREAVLNYLIAVLSDPSTPAATLLGALTFAGHVAAPELAPAVASLWPRQAPNADFVMAFLWATLRCTDEHVVNRLSTALDAWRALPDDDGSPPLNVSSRSSLRYDLPNALARRMEPRAIGALGGALQGEQGRPNGLAHGLATLLRRVDHPEAQEAIVRYAAPLRARERATRGFIPWLSMLASDWRTDVGFSRRPLSQPTRERLLALWQNQAEPEDVRVVAYSIWSANAHMAELPLLQSASADPRHEGLPRLAFWKRLELGDRTAVPQALALAADDTSWYWPLAHSWDDRVHAAVLKELAALLAEGGSDREAQASAEQAGAELARRRVDRLEALAELLARSPADDATTILLNMWPQLSHHPRFVRTALAVATPTSIELAHSAITHGVDAARAFDFVEHDWHLSAHTPDVPTRLHLEAVQPYVALLDDGFLSDLAEGCRRRGFDDWAHQYLVPHLPTEIRQRTYPTDNDLDEILTRELAADRLWYVEHWIEKLSEKPGFQERVVAMGIRHVEGRGDLDALRIAAICLQQSGTRADLRRLAAIAIAGDPDEIAKLIAQTRFAVCRRTGEGFVPKE